MRLGCINVRGWGGGKFEDMSEVLNEWNFDIVGVTETQLREKVTECGEKYDMIGKGRSKWQKKRGGVGVLVRKDVEELNVGDCEMSEDIMAV